MNFNVCRCLVKIVNRVEGGGGYLNLKIRLRVGVTVSAAQLLGEQPLVPSRFATNNLPGALNFQQFARCLKFPIIRNVP